VKSLPFPTFFTLEIESRCNNRCFGCGNVFDHSKENVSKQLTLDEWDTVLNQIRSFAKFVKLTGGEPTLSPIFFPLLELLEKYNIPFFIFTNGRWKDKDHFLKVLKSCRHFRGLLISLHGFDAASHSAFTGVKKSFNETVESIKFVSGSLDTAVNTVITTENCCQIEAIVSLAESIGAKSVSFSRYIGSDLDGIGPNNSQLLSAVKSIEHLRIQGHNVHYGPCIPQCFASSKASSCSAGIASCAIDPWGNVKPCSHSISYAGNLRNSNLLTIWNGYEFQNWRNILPTDCESCSLLDVCGGGCRAQMLLISSEKDPLMNKPSSILISPYEYKLRSTYRPKFLGEISDDSDGKYFVIKGGRVRLVNRSAKNLLECLNGEFSLEQIKDCYGSSALSLVIALYSEGFIKLESSIDNEISKPEMI
jgi:radical SAM protein with 4Fe4S-binding SPASM domain